MCLFLSSQNGSLNRNMNSEKTIGMKKHLITLLTALLSLVVVAQAQTKDSKFGVDSMKTLRNASVYGQLVKQKRYEEALPSWRYVFENAPRFQKNTYIKGVTIMRYMAKKDPKYIDTLMMVYDQRIKYFGNDRKYNKHFLLGRKGRDCYRYKGKTLEGLKEAYTYVNESLKGLGERTEPAVLSVSMAISAKLLEKGELTKEEMLSNYEKYMNVVEKQIQVSPRHKKKLAIVKANIETLFFDAGVADCETLAKLLTPKFDAGIEDVNELKNMMSLLKRSECSDGELYGRLAEKIYKLEPSADLAYDMAILFLKREEFSKTEEYLKEAIATSDSNEHKVDYLLKLAKIKSSQNNYSAVKKYCNEVLALDSKKGEAHLLIGKAYAQYSKKYSKEPFDQHTVFWAAVDRFIKAKSVDPSVAKEANELIKTYSVYFPSKNEAFFRNITPGKKVKIGDWINETTTARFRK